MHQVPLARRNLAAEPRRLVASAIGVGLAVMLILLLDGLWSGLGAQTRLYTDNVGADLYVLQPGVRDLTGGASALPLSTLEAVRGDPGVEWAAPVRTAYVVLDLHSTKVAAYVVGSVPGQRGGAWSLASGRSPARDDEIVVSRVLARRHGFRVGDRVAVMGHALRVVGIANSSGFMFSYVFVTHHAVEAITATAGQTNVVLVGTAKPSTVAARLRSDGMNVLSSDQVAANNQKFATGIFGSPIRLMVGIGLAAGTMIIALTAYTAIVERRREYGIVKAMGGTAGRLVRVALAQTFTLAGLGLVAGLVLFVAGRWAITATRPQFSVVLDADSLGRAVAAAVTMALLAAIIPARRVAGLEPAVAYRSAS